MQDQAQRDYLNAGETIPFLRAALKAAFPGVKFSVRRCRGTAASWADVQWADGPTGEAVHAVTDQFCRSRFDGMVDGYESTGNKIEVDGRMVSPGLCGISHTRNGSCA